MKICTVPLGYADGLIRLLSGQIKFAYKDRAVAQVGNICMDQCMFEVDIRSRVGQPTLDPQIGDVVQIAGPNAHGRYFDRYDGAQGGNDPARSNDRACPSPCRATTCKRTRSGRGATRLFRFAPLPRVEFLPLSRSQL